ncbi:MAG: PEP-CTERM sorting domain-containing protein, partial [Gammaproteobacteria bacterium]
SLRVKYLLKEIDDKKFAVPILLGSCFYCGNSNAALLNGVNVGFVDSTLASFSFGNISANNVGDAAIGESQLSMYVSSWDGSMGGSDTTENRVLFTFINSGPEASSITDVYFDDGTLLGLTGLIDADQGTGGNLGVDFSHLANPGDLPSGNSASPDFETTAGFSADSDAPVQPNGVNPGEYLGVIFDLINGQTVQSVLAAMDPINFVFAGEVAPLGYLRAGIHVQGFASGGSESFVNNPPGTPPDTPPDEPIPEPSSILLMGLGLLGFGASRIKSKKS